MTSTTPTSLTPAKTWVANGGAIWVLPTSKRCSPYDRKGGHMNDHVLIIINTVLLVILLILALFRGRLVP